MNKTIVLIIFSLSLVSCFSESIIKEPRSKEELTKYSLEEIHPEMDRLEKISNNKSLSFETKRTAHKEWMMLSDLIHEKVEQKRAKREEDIRTKNYTLMSDGTYVFPDKVQYIPPGVTFVLEEKYSGFPVKHEWPHEYLHWQGPRQEKYGITTATPTFVGTTTGYQESYTTFKKVNPTWDNSWPLSYAIYNADSTNSNKELKSIDLEADFDFIKHINSTSTFVGATSFLNESNINVKDPHEPEFSISSSPTMVLEYAVYMTQEELDEYNEWKKSKSSKK